MSAREEIFERLEGEKNIPSFPSVVIKLTELLEDPDSTAEDISELIKCDPALSSCLLRLANTIAFNTSITKIAKIDDAIVRLGYHNVKDLVFAISMISNFSKGGFIDYDQFWMHSIAVAFTAKAIRKHAKKLTDHADELYTCGLLHEIGILILDQWIGDFYQPVLVKYDPEKDDLEKLEKEILGVTHSEIGAYLLDKWKLPKSIVESVEHHRNPFKATNTEVGNMTKAVHVAKFACNNQGIYNGVEPEFEINVSSAAWVDLGLTMDKIPTIIDEVKQEIKKAGEVISTSNSFS